MIAKSEEGTSTKELVDQITAELRTLPESKLAVVRELVAFLVARPDVEFGWQNDVSDSDVLKAVKPVLDECWDNPDEDAAWAHL